MCSNPPPSLLGTPPAVEQCPLGVEIEFTYEKIAKLIAVLLVVFENVPDWRSKNIVYKLNVLLTMIALAKLAGCDNPRSMYVWIKANQERFVFCFKIKRNSVPSDNTIRTVLNNVGADFERLLPTMLKIILKEDSPPHPYTLLALDGKHSEGLHTMAVYDTGSGTVLAQCEVADKTNEITAAPQLLEQVELEDVVVCGDALHAQQALSQIILDRGGDYIWPIKENQPTVLAELAKVFEGDGNNEQVRRVAEMVNKGHGRVEKRHITVANVDEFQVHWPGVNQAFLLMRYVHNIATGEKTTSFVYGITSHKTATDEDLLQWTRDYWHIENKLHYRRNVTLNENKLRTKFPNIRKAMATLNNFTVSLLAQYGFDYLTDMRTIFSVEISLFLERMLNANKVLSG